MCVWGEKNPKDVFCYFVMCVSFFEHKTWIRRQGDIIKKPVVVVKCINVNYDDNVEVEEEEAEVATTQTLL